MNKKTMFILMLLFFVFSIIIGTTYSYYVPNIIGNSSSDSLSMSNKNIEINYVNGSNILIDSTHTSVTKHITIKNNGDSLDYLLNFFDITNTLDDLKKLTYSYTCTGVGCENRSDIQVPNIEETLTLLLSIGSGITHTYEITFTYDGTPSGSFTGKINSLAITPIVYGATFNNATSGVRTDNAVGLSFTKGTNTIDSDFNYADIYEDIEYDATDSHGNAFVKIPKFYIKKTKSDGNIWTYQISKIKLDAFYYLPECFKRQSTGEILKYVLVGKYDASINGNKLESKTGKAPLINTNIYNLRNYAKNNGPSYQMLDIHIIDILQTLFYIEFATLDSQSVMMGYGYTKLFNYTRRNSGTTDGVATPSGSQTANSSDDSCMKYRGIENLYGHLWQYIDGVNVKDLKAYVAKNPDNYASDVFDGGYVPIGYTNAPVASFLSTNNYVVEIGHDPNYPYVNFPISIGKLSDSLYIDKYQASNGNVITLFGGSLNNTNTFNGISYWAIEQKSSATGDRAGARLIKKAFE